MIPAGLKPVVAHGIDRGLNSPASPLGLGVQAVVAVGGAQVDGVEHPQGAAGFEVLGKHGLQQAQPAPLDECTEQIDPLLGGDYVKQGLPHRGFVASVNQQGAVGQGDEWADGYGLVSQLRREPDLRGVKPCGDISCLLL